MMTKRITCRFVCASLLMFSLPAIADTGPSGRYRLVGGPDVASELDIKPDGRFAYALSAGALDEHADGYWRATGQVLQLFTDPKPVPAIFSEEPALKTDREELTLLVTWPNGRGIAGIDFKIGFAAGDPVVGYTQEYGWSLSPDEARVPIWIELVEPIHGVVSPRFPLDTSKGSALRFILTPNDIEVFDFQGAQIDVLGDQLVLHRSGVELKYNRIRY